MTGFLILWLGFLVFVGWVIHRWGTDGGNAIWLGGIAFIMFGNLFCALFLPRFG